MTEPALTPLAEMRAGYSLDDLRALNEWDACLVCGPRGATLDMEGKAVVCRRCGGTGRDPRADAPWFPKPTLPTVDTTEEP